MTAHDDEQRGTGRTTEQMKRAPQGAIFFWCNSHIEYPRSLALSLGRTDLTIEPASALDSPEKFRGQQGKRYLLDHAFESVQPDDSRTYRRLKAFNDICRLNHP